MTTLSDNIKHIVVLMLENRSFDNVFGYLYPDRPDFDGLNSPNAKGNPAPDGTTIAPWTNPSSANASTLPTPDPGESFADITQQLFGTGALTAAPQMQGFTANYVRNGGNAQDIMHCFSSKELPALTQLAQSYAVSDRWFASAPCQTWPNRFFVHTGTANGYENNDMAGFPFPMQTIFNELAPTFKWRIYFHDFAQAALLHRLWPYFTSFRPFLEFLDDVNSDAMPSCRGITQASRCRATCTRRTTSPMAMRSSRRCITPCATRPTGPRRCSSSPSTNTAAATTMCRPLLPCRRSRRVRGRYSTSTATACACRP